MNHSDFERARIAGHYLVYRNGYYGTRDGEIIYEGASILQAAKVAAKCDGRFGAQVVRPDSYDEDHGLTSREKDIIDWADFNEYKRREREKATGK